MMLNPFGEIVAAILEGRVVVEQSMPSRNSGTVRYRIKVDPKETKK